jgi:hypothetical protein
MSGASWILKDCFAARHLRTAADALSPEKRAVINRSSAFRSLLNVAPFTVPNRLLDFIVTHTSYQLREFNYRGKRIVFTRDMVRKVFDIPSGNRPVVLIKRSDQCELRDIYKEGNARPPISRAEKLLETCDATDEDTIIRSWDLLVLATVLNPGSGNMLSMDYLGSLLEPSTSNELQWDQHILDVAMEYVRKIQEKKEKMRESGAQGGEFWICGPLPFLGVCLPYPECFHFLLCFPYLFPPFFV